MEYIYYKYSKGNFGDDLNGYLWPRIFGPDTASDSYLLGIGTMLQNDVSFIKDLSPDRKKIVFGAGARPSYNPLILDKNWEVSFLRGPLSAYYLNKPNQYIADAAYAIRHIDDFSLYQNVEKKYEVSFMPYFMSNHHFDWKAICEDLNIHYISPWTNDEEGVVKTIRDIASSKCIIAEAMHGAILADILRVPWHRLVLAAPHYEGSMVSEFKWLDWQSSIGVTDVPLTHIDFFKKTYDNWFYWKTFGNKYYKKLTDGFMSIEFLLKKSVTRDIYNTLPRIKDFHLSSDNVINGIDSRISEKIALLR